MKVSNPLTIIAIFAGLAEALATIALIKLPIEMQEKFIYFVMAFPTLIVTLFFIVLYFKNNVLYAPSDYQDPEHYLKINQIELKKAFDSAFTTSKESLETNNALEGSPPRNDNQSTTHGAVDPAKELLENLSKSSLGILITLLLYLMINIVIRRGLYLRNTLHLKNLSGALQSARAQ